MPVSNQVTNLKGTTPGILSDILANRPTPGFTGSLFVQTDGTYGIYRDTGTAWVLVASGSGASTPTLQNVLTAGNVATLPITATSFITTGGTSAQFVKGDGSLDSTVYLAKNNPAYTGTITTGTQLFTPANALISVQSSVNSYNQVILTNTSSGASASTDFIVGNNNSTDTTYYGDFGMNSSGYVGTGNFNTANAVYLYSYSSDLSIGTFTSNAIHFIINNGSTDALTINTSGQLYTPNQITALKYIVNGGVSTQFLKGDGSLDSTTYLTAGSAVSTFSGGTTGFTPNTATSGAIVLSGTLNVANGGTGVTTLASLASNAAFSSLYQGLNTNLTNISGLTFASLSFVKMSAAGTFSLDTSVYITAASVASTYVPYSGATGAVTLGSNSFTAGAASFTNGAFSSNLSSNQTSNNAWIYQALNGSGVTLGGFYRGASGQGILIIYNSSGVGNVVIDGNTGTGVYSSTITAKGAGASQNIILANNNSSVLVAGFQQAPLNGGTVFVSNSSATVTAYIVGDTGTINLTGRCNVNGAADSASYALNVAGVSQIVTSQTYINNITFFTEIVSTTITGAGNNTGSTEVLIAASSHALGVNTSGTNTLTTSSLMAATVSKTYVNGSGGSFNKVSAWAGTIEFSNSNNITDASCLYTGVPYQQAGQGAYTGTITNFYGLLIEDISSNTNIGSKITNKYGIYQRGASDINFFNGAIQLGTGNTLSASTTNTNTNKIKIIVNGTTLYLLASTSSV